MKQDILLSLRTLADDELDTRVRRLVASERGAMAELVAHLAEFDTRDVFLRAGYSSLFVYCRDALGLSEHEAYDRIAVARAARQFPVILEMLAEGWVNLTTVRLLAPHLTSENCREVLESARGKRKVEVEEIVARLSPRPDAPVSVRKLTVPEVAPAPLIGDTPLVGETAAVFPPVSTVQPAAAPARVAEVRPLSPDRYKIQLTISGETLEKLRLAKDMLRHAIPTGDEAAILDRALTALLTDLARTKFADTRRPRRSRAPAASSRQLSAEVKRRVWLRDHGRCAFVGSGGRRCDERGFLEFHHVDPYANGGPPTVDNIQLRCRRHNDYESRAFFGQRRAADESDNPLLVPARVRETKVGDSRRPPTESRSAAGGSMG